MVNAPYWSGADGSCGVVCCATTATAAQHTMAAISRATVRVKTLIMVCGC
jgi:hypothetical protein